MTLYPKRSQAIGLFFLCAIFVTIGICMGVTGDWVGYPIAGFFGLGVVVFTIQLIPGSAYLHLDQEGFTYCNLYRSKTLPWSVIDRFHVVAMKQTGLKVHEMVGFSFVPSYDKSQLGRQISSVVAACEGGLPNTYGKSAEELASLMNEHLQVWRERNNVGSGS
tara:strand:- start:66 stop:554 length:489 start_codon:yes stop_codon:yes gene_type:complete